METKPRILIIYTGGTIGMIKNPVTNALETVDFNLIFDRVPELNRLQIEIDNKSVKKPVDSSDMNISHWREIAKMVSDNYVDYDGFLILHGTDTMAYTASALSFMFEGLKKPIVLTGAQLPIGIIRTDGKNNLISALEVVAEKRANGEPMIQEVAVFFDDKLFRGNRSTKDSATHFEAFRSPNFEALAIAGVKIEYYENRFFSSANTPFITHRELNNRVALVKLFPGIKFELYKDVFNKDHVDGVVIETFGAGNTPSSEYLKKLILDFMAEGGVVLNITQCNSGTVKQGFYESSADFQEIGVISGGNMTTEAAMTKMMVFLDIEDLEKSKQVLAQEIRGEVDY